MNSNVTASWRAHKRGALFANPCFTQIHPTCIPVTGEHQSKLTLMSESLRNDGRVWVPKKQGDTRPPEQIPEDERDYYLERKYPSFGNLVPRDVASRNAKQVCDDGRGVGDSGLAVYLDFRDAIQRLGVGTIEEIDAGMRLGCGHPMGPFTLLDFVGLDTTYYIAGIMFDEFKEARFAPPPLLKRMVLAGMLGRKTGKGFYDYSQSPPVPLNHLTA